MTAWARRHGALLSILLVAAVVRLTWLGSIPVGLNPDEASIAYDSWALLHYGMDRNGQSWPVHLISWGSGQNALYAYLSFPFVALFGPGPVGIRSLQAVAGIATVSPVYYIALRAFDRRTALLATAFVAFSPWHIALSRWALEANLVVAVFTAAFACLLADRRPALGLAAGAFLLGISLYAYGSAWVAAPLMLLFAIVVAWRAGRVDAKGAALAAAVFAITAVPIALFVAVNSLRWPALALGPLTIPRLTSAPRYETQTAARTDGFLATSLENLSFMYRTIRGEADGLPWNSTPPFGLFYHLLGSLALIGVVLIVGATLARHYPRIRDLAGGEPRRASHRGRYLLLGWVACALPIGLLQPVYINRINLIFVPLLILAAWPIACLADRRARWPVLPLAGVLLALGLAAFLPAYSRQERRGFDADMIPAVVRARALAGAGTVCVTTRTEGAYVYALLADRTDPQLFASTVRYADPADPFRTVTRFRGYAFGRCPSAAVYIFAPGDTPTGTPVARIGRYVIATRR